MAGQTLPTGAWPWLHHLARAASATVFPARYRLRVFGRERIPASGPVVVVSNHSAMADGPILLGQLGRPVAFLIKDELFRGVLGAALRRIGQLAVRRGEPDRTPLLTGVRLLRAGGMIGVFPEGTRGDGDVLSAQDGAAWLARASGAVILPVALRGTLVRPGVALRPRVDVLFGDAFAVPTLKGRRGLTEATDLIRTRLAELVSELDRLRAGRGAGVGVTQLRREPS